MRFTKNLINFFFCVLGMRIVLGFLLDFHAVISPFSTLKMKLYVATFLTTLDSGADVHSFAATDDATGHKLRKVHLVHLNRCLRSHLRPAVPHGARVVHPVIETVSHGRVPTRQLTIISLYKVPIIIRNAMVFRLIFRVIEIYSIL